MFSRKAAGEILQLFFYSCLDNPSWPPNLLLSIFVNSNPGIGSGLSYLSVNLLPLMNWGHLHLITNHFPIAGVFIGTLILSVGMILKAEGVKLSGLGTIAFSAVMSFVVYLTGDSAEQAVKGLSDVPENLINRHEDIASISMYLIIPAGLVAILALYSIWKREKSTFLLSLVTLVLSILSSLAMAYAGYTGGQIRHSEFRSDSSKHYILDQ
jgi:uncharacterized membrane protein